MLRRSQAFHVFGSTAIALIVMAGSASAADLWKGGASEVYAFVFENGGHQVDFTDQYVGNECVSAGSPGDSFTFGNNLALDNSAGQEEITVDYAIAIYEWVAGARGNALYSGTTSLTAGAGEYVSGSLGGVAVEYTGWNGDTSCGGNFEVYRSIDFPGAYLPTFSRDMVY